MKISFRVDASVEIGTGHVVRCLALADALSRTGAECRFIMRNLPGNMADVVRTHNHTVTLLPAPDQLLDNSHISAHAHWLGIAWVTDAIETEAALAAADPQDWLVVDHYALDERWERQLRSRCKWLMVIDDLADRRHDCDLLLDQNLTPDSAHRYDELTPDHCRKLIGPRFALLRPEFSQARLAKLPDRSAPVKRVLLFFGGTDSQNMSLRVASAIEQAGFEGIYVDLVIGKSNPHSDELEAWCKTRRWIYLHQGGVDMAELMKQADLSVGAGGITSWGRACLGLPSIVIAVADNQIEGAQQLARQGAILFLGDHTEINSLLGTALSCLINNPWLRVNFSARSAALVDGLGITRTIRRMAKHDIKLRLAEFSDSSSLLSWRNDPLVRLNSRSDAMISVEAHQSWLAETLSNPDRDLLIGEIEGVAVGVLRFDHHAARALISVYLTPGLTGRGFGSALLDAGTAWLAEHRPDCLSIDAEVLIDNQASHLAFSEAGYTRIAHLYHLEIKL